MAIEMLSERRILLLKGPDSAGLLQSLVTNDILQYSFTHNYLLNNTGRCLFDFFVAQMADDEFLIDISSADQAAFTKKLLAYRLRKDCMLKDISDEVSIAYSTESIKDLCIFSDKDPRHEMLGYRCYLDKAHLEQFDLVSDIYAKDKYGYCIPDSEDLTKERSMPLEYGAEELGSVSFAKGCYIGQEVVSRTKYQGVVRKKLFKLIAEQSLSGIARGAEINLLPEHPTTPQKKIGHFCSSYKNFAICLMNEEIFLGLPVKKVIINNITLNIEMPPWRK